MWGARAPDIKERERERESEDEGKKRKCLRVFVCVREREDVQKH